MRSFPYKGRPSVWLFQIIRYVFLNVFVLSPPYCRKETEKVRPLPLKSSRFEFLQVRWVYLPATPFSVPVIESVRCMIGRGNLCLCAKIHCFHRKRSCSPERETAFQPKISSFLLRKSNFQGLKSSLCYVARKFRTDRVGDDTVIRFGDEVGIVVENSYFCRPALLLNGSFLARSSVSARDRLRY